MPVTADQVLSNLNVIRNSLVVDAPNNAILDSVTAPRNPVAGTGNVVSKYLGSAPLLLHSLALIGDSTFIADYSFLVVLNGLNISNNTYALLAGAATGQDYVPTGKVYLIPANSTLDIYAYNSGGSSSTGHLSVLAVFDDLSYLAPDELAKL